MNTWNNFGIGLPQAADSYKAGHWSMFPEGTTFVKTFMESRGSGLNDSVIFFGLQYYLKNYLSGQIVTKELVDKAEKFWNAHLGPGHFSRDNWMYIVEKHNGYLPIKIKSVKEGTKVKNRNVLFTVENTDPKCFWLTNYIETLLIKIWYPTTIATNGYKIRNKILEYLEKTGNLDLINFAYHCFGYRSCTSEEQAGIGSMAHLVNFMGTDTVAGIWFAQDAYNTDGMLGYSVKACEHSGVLSWAGEEFEIEFFRNLLQNTPTGILSVVSDTFDILKAVDKFGELKELVLNRDGKLVIRPVSGDPAMTDLMVIEKLAEHFGYTINEKGYKVLNPKVGVIQGDFISFDTICEILELLEKNGWSADNIVFGCGTKNLQEFSRDSFNFAIKASVTNVNGEDRCVEKCPLEINKDGSRTKSFKKSKKGHLKLVKENGEYKTLSNFDEGFDEAVDELVTVFENGEVLVEYTFEEIRERVRQN